MISMEVKIENKKNNQLLNRTEVYFTITHEGEGTPNREIIRNELADKLNTKKENIVVDSLSSGFGIRKTEGYAKVYTSIKQAKGLEREHLLVRNKIAVKEETKKDEKKEGATPAAKQEKTDEKPTETVKEEKPSEDKKEEKTDEKPETDEKTTDGKKEEAIKTDDKKTEETKEKENTDSENKPEEKKE